MWCLQKGRPRYWWQNRICYCKKSLNAKVFFFFLIKVWNMKNVSIWFQEKPILQLSMFCLIQEINNYMHVQINTYWSYIVHTCIFINLTSNILLLASMKCFLTSQELVRAGMNCRALCNVCTYFTVSWFKWLTILFRKSLDFVFCLQISSTAEKRIVSKKRRIQ